MGKTPLIDPFNHESRREKKLRAKHSARDLASQQTLSSLVNGTYQPPRMANHSRLRSSTSSRTSEDIGNSYQQEYHYVPDPDDHFEAESQSHIPHESHNRSVAATAALSSWGSIPWDVPSSIPNRPSSSFNLLNPEITAAVRDHDRNASHH
ncbi:hypothetical protein MJO28_017382 [Puccinia striiformis f. sp. tritici]|nr:hypothetical protein Pst134EB_020275 [Puccinia striiformis f. sp. tritici]KAI7933947.1 hypothetical protein MJO28_017382 [Puccinia striiformis f. sp. tritici]